MKRNTCHKLLRPLVWALVFFFAALPAAAQPTVQVKVSTKGDLLLVDTTSKGLEPVLRMNPSPAYLELAFPGAALSGKPFSKMIDKGLVQKVVTSESGGKALTRVYVLSKPKSKLTKTASGYQYTVNLREMASAAKPARKPAPKKPAASKPAKPVPKPVASKPVKPAAKPVGRKAPVTANFQNTPLKLAIEQIAKQAGLKTEIDPSIAGTVNGNFRSLAFDNALSQLLSPLGKKVDTKYSKGLVSIKMKQAPAKPTTSTSKPAAASKPAATKPATTQKPAPTKPAATAPRTVSAPVAAAPTQVMREYFPYKKKSAAKAMEAAKLAFPNLTYAVDPVLNVLMVEGSPSDIAQLEKFLRAQSPK